TNSAVLDTPSEGVHSGMFSLDGKTLAAVSSSSPEVYIWDVASGKIKGTFEHSDRRHRPRLLRFVWDAFPSIFKECTHVPLSVLFTPDGKFVAFGFDNCETTIVKMWQVTADSFATK